MKQPQRVAVFGGSFNPIHNAHTSTASAFVKKLKLDKLIFIPSAQPVHKSGEEYVSAEHRLNMCRLAAQSVKKSEVSDMEITRGGASYTVDTLAQLRGTYPDSELFLITGADMFMTIHEWKNPREIFSLACICTAPRGEYDLNALQEQEKRLNAMGARTYILDAEKMDVSSSKVRELVYNDGDISALVDANVERYIYSNYLFMDKSTINLKRIDKVLLSRMGVKRFMHSLNVAAESRWLAERYGADPRKAQLAGLLHDIAKETPPDEQMKIMENAGENLSDVERSAPKLWHAIAGAAFVRSVMGIEDEDIYHAIRSHTSGRAGMSTLEKVVFTADFIGLDRDYEEADKMRELAGMSLEYAMEFGLSFSISDLATRRLTIDPNSVLCYNEIVMQNKRKKSDLK